MAGILQREFSENNRIKLQSNLLLCLSPQN